MRAILVFLSILFSVELRAQEYSNVPFDTKSSWEEIQKEATDKGKFIFVDVFTTWCGPCKMMDQNVYKNDTVLELMKRNFISVRVQMDSTSSDNDYAKTWYKKAAELASKYKINGYPSYLFFSPNGELVLQDIGYKDVGSFVDMSLAAIAPERVRYNQLLKDYKSGVKEYRMLGGLAIFVKDVVKDKNLAASIAEDYKQHYLDSASEALLQTSENLDFIGRFSYLIHVKDGIFKLCYYKGGKVDSIMHIKGWAGFQVRNAICRDEVVDRLIKGGKVIDKNPDWKSIEERIAKKYNLPDTRQLMVQQKLDYYRYYNLNWPLWAATMDEKLRITPPVNDGGVDIFMKLNMPAWDVFLNCTDKSVIKKALGWSNRSIGLEQPIPNIQYLDTRAQLLYKLGKIADAIIQEQKAVETGKAMIRKNGSDTGAYLEEMQETLAKMEKKERTWPADADLH